MAQLLLAASLTALTIGIDAVVLACAVLVIRRVGPRLSTGHTTAKLIVSLMLITLWLLVGFLAASSAWAVALFGVGALPDLESALYFSMVAFTTLGLGDITLPHEWRLLSGLIAANGLVLFSLNTAFMFEFVKRVTAAAVDTRDSV